MSIRLLRPEEFSKCSGLWDLQKQNDLADRFLTELISGNRITYVFEKNRDFLGEVSLVKEMPDSDYTVPNQSIYMSHLIVKKSERRKGIGKALVSYGIDKAKSMGYSEISIGVDMDNYPAIQLYFRFGFDRIAFVGEDTQGRYFKLIKSLV